MRQLSGAFPRWGQKPDIKRKTSYPPAERTVLLALMGDPSADVRAAVFEAMKDVRVEADEVDRLIELLERKPGDLRNGCLTRLRTLGDQALLAAADRLVADESEQRRVAGLELLRDAAEGGRLKTEVRIRMEKFATAAAAVAETERAHVAAVLEERTDKATADDALGLHRADRASVMARAEGSRAGAGHVGRAREPDRAGGAGARASGDRDPDCRG